MAELADQIEVLENRYMRAWASGDAATLRQLTGRGFQLVIGSKPAVMLDRASWLDAAQSRFVSTGFRFGGVYVREVGGMALFASQVELEARLDDHDWSGVMWMTDLWRKGRVRRRWRLAARVFSRPEEDKAVPQGIRAMQLWR